MKYIITNDKDELISDPYIIKFKKQKSGNLISKEIKGFYIDVDWLWKDPMPSSFECLKGILKI
jgi:hypothetical protein